jgi:hypothetical protein
MERLPPTQDALLQHSRRVAYQAGIWCTSEQNEQHTKDGDGHLMMTANRGFQCGTLACSELIKCSCKSQRGCGARCA